MRDLTQAELDARHAQRKREALGEDPGILTFDIYGHKERCRILADHGMGTLDVERIRDGKCFRISGLPMVNHDE